MKHGGGEVLSGVDDPLDAEHGLCSWKQDIVGSGVTEMRKARPPLRPGACRKKHATGATVKVEAKLRPPAPQSRYRGSEYFGHVRITAE